MGKDTVYLDKLQKIKLRSINFHVNVPLIFVPKLCTSRKIQLCRNSNVKFLYIINKDQIMEACKPIRIPHLQFDLSNKNPY